MKNEELVRYYINILSTRQFDKETLDSKWNSLRKMGRDLKVSFLHAKPEDIRNLIISKKESREWTTKSTIREYIYRLNNFYRFLIAEQLLEAVDNPMPKIKNLIIDKKYPR